MDEQREITYDDIKSLTRWMAENGYTAVDIADAVEKPWKYDDELRTARQALADPALEQ